MSKNNSMKMIAKHNYYFGGFVMFVLVIFLLWKKECSSLTEWFIVPTGYFNYVQWIIFYCLFWVDLIFSRIAFMFKDNLLSYKYYFYHRLQKKNTQHTTIILTTQYLTNHNALVVYLLNYLFSIRIYRCHNITFH